MIEEDYQPYQQEFDLPSFDKIESDFDLLQADSEYPIKSILKQMQDKIESLMEILGDILQPTPESITQMHEYSYVSEIEKKIVLDTYKELNFFVRSIHEAQLMNDKHNSAHLINEIVSNWSRLKKQALPIVTKLKESWKKELLTTENQEYFG